MMEILVCDDHPLCQIGIEIYLKRILGEGLRLRQVSNGKDMLLAAKDRRPDVIFLDLGLPDFAGVDLARQLLHEYPETHIIVITGCEDPTTLNLVAASGVDAVMSKSYSLEGLQDVFQSLSTVRSQGKTFMDPVIRNLTSSIQSEGLTPREWEVLDLIAQGFTNRDIAEKLNCSIETVKTHRVNLGQKVAARNRAELTAWYLQRKKNLNASSASRNR